MRINQRDEDGNTALNTAVIKDDFSLVKLLVSKGATNSKNKSQKTAFDEAIEHDRKVMLEFFVEQKFGLNNKLTFMPVHFATKLGMTDMVKYLIDELHIKNYDISFEICLVRSRMPKPMTNSDNISPLSIACKEGFKDIVEFLLSKNNSLNSNDKKGLSPLKQS